MTGCLQRLLVLIPPLFLSLQRCSEPTFSVISNLELFYKPASFIAEKKIWYPPDANSGASERKSKHFYKHPWRFESKSFSWSQTSMFWLSWKITSLTVANIYVVYCIHYFRFTVSYIANKGNSLLTVSKYGLNFNNDFWFRFQEEFVESDKKTLFNIQWYSREGRNKKPINCIPDHIKS